MKTFHDNISGLLNHKWRGEGNQSGPPDAGYIQTTCCQQREGSSTFQTLPSVSLTKMERREGPDLLMLDDPGPPDGECFCWPDPVLWTLHMSGDHPLIFMTFDRNYCNTN